MVMAKGLDLSVRSEKIYTLHDQNSDGVFDKATLFADGFNNVLTGVAACVTPIGGHVYTTIIPDLWKLTDTNGDGIADSERTLSMGSRHILDTEIMTFTALFKVMTARSIGAWEIVV